MFPGTNGKIQTLNFVERLASVDEDLLWEMGQSLKKIISLQNLHLVFSA